MAKDYFKHLYRIYKTILEMFSKIYELKIADTPRYVEGMSEAAIALEEMKYESAQRLFAYVNFAEIEAAFKLANQLNSEEKLTALFEAMNSVAK
jgi:hypothetical protein